MTAVAAALLPHGDTVHKTFGIKVRDPKHDLTERSLYEPEGCDEGLALKNAGLIVIDEVSMMAKWQISLIDLLLQVGLALFLFCSVQQKM